MQSHSGILFIRQGRMDRKKFEPSQLEQFWFRSRIPSWQPSNFSPPSYFKQSNDKILTQAESAFHIFDKGRSCFLTKHNCVLALEKMGFSRSVSRDMIAVVDTDSRGLVHFDDFSNVALFLKSGGNLEDIELIQVVKSVKEKTSKEKITEPPKQPYREELLVTP